jgi:uncharacterized protein (DUF2062 family)
MVRRRVAQVRKRVKDRLVETFLEAHTPGEVAFSFSLGVFITMLPTLGVGVLAFFILAALFDRLSKIAMFASVLVFNPVVKWGVYGASYSLGTFMLGPAPGVSFDGVSLSAGPDILVRLWTGNLILAVIAASAGYVVGLRLINEFRRRTREDEVHREEGTSSPTVAGDE